MEMDVEPFRYVGLSSLFKKVSGSCSHCLILHFEICPSPPTLVEELAYRLIALHVRTRF